MSLRFCIYIDVSILSYVSILIMFLEEHYFYVQVKWNNTSSVYVKFFYLKIINAIFVIVFLKHIDEEHF